MDNGIAKKVILLYDVKNKEWSKFKGGKICDNVICWMPLDMSEAKYNKKYLGLRIITSPIKLIFTLIWNILLSFIITYKWVVFGSQELLYGVDGKESLVNLIKQNEELIKKLK